MEARTIPKKPAPIKYTVAMSKEMKDALEEEMKVRKIATVPEVIRIIISDHFTQKES